MRPLGFDVAEKHVNLQLNCEDVAEFSYQPGKRGPEVTPDVDRQPLAVADRRVDLVEEFAGAGLAGAGEQRGGVGGIQRGLQQVIAARRAARRQLAGWSMVVMVALPSFRSPRQSKMFACFTLAC